MSEENWRRWIRKNVQAANPLLWILDNSLACAPRPLRYHPTFGGRVELIAPEAAPVLREWLEALRAYGIGTIVALATPGEMKRYSAVVSPQPDLLSLYRSFGFLVHHHPVEDPAHSPLSAKVGILRQMERLGPVVIAEYEKRVGGMLISCSGGMDRSAPIAAFVANKVAGPFPFV
jgi:Cyclin-dependent kinase inhibitor 3 (CDKN3)